MIVSMEDFNCFFKDKNSDEKYFVILNIKNKNNFLFTSISSENVILKNAPGVCNINDNSFRGHVDFSHNEENFYFEIEFDLSLYDKNKNSFYSFGNCFMKGKDSEQVVKYFAVEVWKKDSNILCNAATDVFFEKIRQISSEVEKINSLNEENTQSLDKNNKLLNVIENNNEKLKSDQESILSEIDSFHKNQEELSNLLSDIKKKHEEISALCDENNHLKEEIKSTYNEASSVSQKAKDALEITTTMSLARSFKSRKDEARKSARIFSIIFYISSTIAVFLGALYLILSRANLNSSNYLISWGNRIPIIIFMIWIVYFSSKKSSQQYALMEFYAQKQSLAESYQGYKEQIENINIEDKTDLQALMKINLSSIAKDSSEVFERSNREEHNPVSEIASKLMDRAQK